MTAQTFVVGVHPYGERFRAVVVSVNANRAPEVEALLAAGEDPRDELLLAASVKDTARAAVAHVLELATGDMADELGIR